MGEEKGEKKKRSWADPNIVVSPSSQGVVVALASHLVALVLEVAALLHHGVRLGEILVGEGAAGLDIGFAHAELGTEHLLSLVPGGGDANALEVGRSLDSARTDGSAGGGGRLAAARWDLGARPDGGHGAGGLSSHLCGLIDLGGRVVSALLR